MSSRYNIKNFVSINFFPLGKLIKCSVSYFFMYKIGKLTIVYKTIFYKTDEMYKHRRSL